MDTQRGPLALVGSGEYLPQMEPVERALLRGRGHLYIQLATAAAPEGPRSLDRWHRLGAEAAQRLGAEQVIVDVRDRADADRPELASLVRGAGLIYLSGGNPTYLAETLRGTLVWQAIAHEWSEGAALAGCSAGAMALADHVVHPLRPQHGVAGLGAVPGVRIIPHFDRWAGRLPDLALRPWTGGSQILLGIDEDTALVGGPHEWTVHGRGCVWWLHREGRVAYAAGQQLDLRAAR